VKRTQLYLDDDLWNTLHSRARNEKTTVSNLVRVAVREHYMGKSEEQRKAMQAFVGIRANDSATSDAVDYVRALRRGSRLERLHK
jgi:Arc/MetJ family transcription regulator